MRLIRSTCLLVLFGLAACGAQKAPGSVNEGNYPCSGGKPACEEVAMYEKLRPGEKTSFDNALHSVPTSKGPITLHAQVSEGNVVFTPVPAAAAAKEISLIDKSIPGAPGGVHILASPEAHQLLATHAHP
jgi:hypothetical protein